MLIHTHIANGPHHKNQNFEQAERVDKPYKYKGRGAIF